MPLLNCFVQVWEEPWISSTAMTVVQAANSQQRKDKPDGLRGHIVFGLKGVCLRASIALPCLALAFTVAFSAMVPLYEASRWGLPAVNSTSRPP